MAKGGGRHAISQSKEDSSAENLHVHYCLCGEFLLVLDAPLAALARRPADGALVLPNSGPAQRVYKLNASEVGKDLVKPDTKAKKGEADAVGGAAQVGAAGKEGNGVLVNREGGFEFQRRLFCPRCQLQVGYETRPGEGQRGPATFILPGALSTVQNQAPADAFGPPAVTEAGDVSGGAEQAAREGAEAGGAAVAA
ncbi:uncharacterized protein RHOBADRAFT_51897 [Rhodotorula graminis WP1]|uniref:STEEP1 domain-containing protein n=1 Tax=Rhodotorula graminis (strain WP1) TaxID=578459 RepID=A0A194S8L6_RHOGW|nr:uncharacterized protein RHOBADRAFT_51897 [Rhodotorula graminis WP1]KPV76914.1 hypothetical protein RHOBADRAFT_51897 [Rhodotorula graminis WP1]